MDIFNEVELLTITYRSSHIINQTLSGIDQKFKITIVENSDDIFFKKKIENRNNTKCILNYENLGFVSAFNVGAKTINSKYLLHFNPDALINDEIIHKLYEISKKQNFGIISVNESNDKTFIADKNFNDLKEVENVKGFVMFVNNQECKTTGYFDENFFLYLEEIDLCKRLLKENKKIFVAKNLFVKHLGGQSHDPKFSEKMELQRNWHYIWSLFYFSKKHYGLTHAYKITFKKFLSAFIKSFIYFFLNKKKFLIYKHRFLGLLNSYLGRKSFFRIN